MGILVHGDKSNIMTFAYTNCGCVFQANRSEVDWYVSISAKNVYICPCPECKKNVSFDDWGWV